MKYTAMFDAGKPYEESFEDEVALEKALRDFYYAHKDDDYPFDCKVYDMDGQDLTDSYIIESMIGEIMGGEE